MCLLWKIQWKFFFLMKVFRCSIEIGFCSSSSSSLSLIVLVLWIMDYDRFEMIITIVMMIKWGSKIWTILIDENFFFFFLNSKLVNSYLEWWWCELKAHVNNANNKNFFILVSIVCVAIELFTTHTLTHKYKAIK